METHNSLIIPHGNLYPDRRLLLLLLWCWWYHRYKNWKSIIGLVKEKIQPTKFSRTPLLLQTYKHTHTYIYLLFLPKCTKKFLKDGNECWYVVYSICRYVAEAEEQQTFAFLSLSASISRKKFKFKFNFSICLF